jgi:type III secretion protein Q
MDMSDSDIEAIPVKLAVELGQIDSTLGEVSRLSEGAVLPLASPVSEPVQLIANGRRIGYGALVRIGDGLGVRVTRLIQD